MTTEGSPLDGSLSSGELQGAIAALEQHYVHEQPDLLDLLGSVAAANYDEPSEARSSSFDPAIAAADDAEFARIVAAHNNELNDEVAAAGYAYEDLFPLVPHMRRGDHDQDGGRAWTLHPVHPPELLGTTSTDYLDIGEEYVQYLDGPVHPSQVVPETLSDQERQGKQDFREFVAAYNVLDYRLQIAMKRENEEFALASQFDGRDILGKFLRKFGAMGENAELCIAEVMNGNLENVIAYEDRWFVIHGNVVDGKPRMEVDYYSLEEVSDDTLRKYQDALYAPRDERLAKLFGGREAGKQGAGESGRGIAITAAIAIDGTATIGRIGRPKDGWVHLSFAVDDTYPDNPLAEAMSEDDLLAAFADPGFDDF